MRTEINITRNFKEKSEAYYVARAGLMQAIYELIRIETTPFQPLPDEEIQPMEEEEEEKADWRINIKTPDISFGTGTFSVKIENEAGKININMADANLLRMMLNNFDLDDTEKDVIVDSILDWRDEDTLQRLNGAEDDYYLSLSEPYHAKNDDFESVEELLLVRGVTPEIFHGGLEDIITVYTEKQGARSMRSRRQRGRTGKNFSYNKININFASEAMLKALPQMTEEIVRDLMEFRKEKDLSMPDILEIAGPGTYAEIAPYITTARDAKSPFFTIVSEGRFQDGPVKHRIEAMLKIDARSEKKYKILRWVDQG
ncbi:MAG: type II secretion system protein GspK [Desulfobacterales bacterium]